MKSRFLALLWLLFALPSTGSLTAQEDDAEDQAPATTVRDEVVVTAQRVEQTVQEVPISLIALDGEELEQTSIDDVSELATTVPGLVISGQASSDGQVSLFLRGIGSSTQGIGVESTVGFYVDGIYVPRPQALVTDFLDVQRVEVLRGPQGTLWGRNSTGGALNVITRSPQASFRGRLMGEYAELDGPASAEEQRYNFSLSGPLSDRIWGRLAAQRAVADDFTLNRSTGSTVRNADSLAGRVGVTFAPADDWALTVRLDAVDDDAHDNFQLRPQLSSDTNTLGTLLRFFDIGLPTDVHAIASDLTPISEYQESGLSVHGDWSLAPNVRLESITGYRELESFRRSDIDGTPLEFVENLDSADVDWWSQELKLNGSTERTEWIAGLYYFEEEAANFTDLPSDQALFSVFFFASNPQLFLFDPTDFCSLGFVAPTSFCGIDYYGLFAPSLGLPLPGNKASANFFDRSLSTESAAVYGQLYWHLSDRLTLTGGLRYTDDSKRHQLTTLDFTTFTPQSRAESDGWSALTPKVGVEFRPNDETMLYGSVTTGYKSGGFNSTSIQPSFDEESITSYEVGIKSSLLDRELTLNASAFLYDYDDLQVQVLFPDRSRVENAASAEVQGVELDLRYQPTYRLGLSLGVALLDDEFDGFFSQDPVTIAGVQDELSRQGIFDPVAVGMAVAAVPVLDLSGNGLPRAPDTEVTASLQYTFELGESELTALGRYQYTDDIAFDPFERLVQESYGVFDASLRYTPGSGGWWVNVYGRNLGDEEYRLTELFVSFTGSLAVWAPPRSYGVQVGWGF